MDLLTTAWRGRPVAPLLADPYRGVPLGVESAWPASVRIEE
jgi:hypothetical protein